MRPMLPRLLACVVMTLTPNVCGATARPDPDPARTPAESWVGVWRNTNNTVHIKAVPCGDNSMCGTVVWANDQAKADVAAKGRQLIGMQLFRSFRQTSPMEWQGKVFIPDIGSTFSGKIKLTDRNNLVAVGCFFAGFGCQTRHWSRIY